jgi:hypothetical protein
MIAAKSCPRTRSILAVAALLVCLPGAKAANAQTAGEIIDRYVEAIGGSEALASLNTMKYVRTVLNTQDGQTSQQSRTTIHSMRPYFYRTERADRGRIHVTDGTTAWRGLTAAGSDSVAWEETELRIRSSDLDFDRLLGPFIHFVRKGYSAEYSGTSDREGTSLQVVTVTWKEGHQWAFFFDPDSALCVGFNTNPAYPEQFTRIGDYRRVDGVLIPHRNVTIDRMPDGSSRQHERIYSAIEFNVAIDESYFRPGDWHLLR